MAKFNAKKYEKVKKKVFGISKKTPAKKTTDMNAGRVYKMQPVSSMPKGTTVGKLK